MPGEKQSLWSALKAGLPLGAIFFGALVGPVMVTGSYTVNYFLNYGAKSWVFCILYVVFISIIFFSGFEHTRITHESNPEKNVYDYSTLAKAMYGKKLSRYLMPIYEIWVLLAMIITGASVVATGGILISDLFHIPYVLGAVIMAVCNIVIAVFGADMVRKTSTGMMFAMIGMMFLIMILVAASHGEMLVHNLTTGWTPENVQPFGKGIWRIFTLSASASSWALGLGAMAQKLCSRKSTLIGGISAGVGGAFAFFLMFLILLPFGNEVITQEVPVLNVIKDILGKEYGMWLVVIYYALMMMALVSSGAPSLFVVANRVKTMAPKLEEKAVSRRSTFLIGAVYEIVAIFMAMTGLNTIVGNYFQYLGYLGQVLNLIPLIIIWPILRARGKRPILADK